MIQHSVLCVWLWVAQPTHMDDRGQRRLCRIDDVINLGPGLDLIFLAFKSHTAFLQTCIQLSNDIALVAIRLDAVTLHRTLRKPALAFGPLMLVVSSNWGSAN